MEYAVALPTVDHLRAFAAGLAAGLVPGAVVALSGPVGAGKTTLVVELVRLLGGGAASSPSFTIWQRYDAALPIEHLDLYRIEDPRELRELGLEEAFDGPGCAIVEWPERAPHLIPPHALRVALLGAGDDPRVAVVTRA